MSKGKVIAALLNEASGIQRARVRAHLEAQANRWCTSHTPQEFTISEKALKAFDKGDYSNEAIARYINPDVIEKIFG